MLFNFYFNLRNVFLFSFAIIFLGCSENISNEFDTQSAIVQKTSESNHNNHNHAHHHKSEDPSKENSLQDLVGGGEIDLSSAISSQADPSHHGAHKGHKGLIMDHTSLLELIPQADDSSVNVALKGGSWFNNSAWSKGRAPKKGDSVYIPSGIRMVYDQVSHEKLNTVGVDGELHFAVDKNSQMVVDTFVTGPQSLLTIGVSHNPIHEDKTVNIIIHSDNGPVKASSHDPTQLGRGVITHGVVRIHGAVKTSFLKAVVHPKKGDQVLIFDELPHGWASGDKIVVASAQYRGGSDTTGSCDGFPTIDYRDANPLVPDSIVRRPYQDEIRQIVSIRQQSNRYEVVIDSPLEFDHIPPTISTNHILRVPVANFSRNIKISSDSNDYLGNGRTVASKNRGHVMFMHNPDVKVRYAEFFELGRSNKSKWKDDDNVVGRYALHFHRTGVLSKNAPALAIGNAVWGSHGWGIVHHDAHLDVNDNAVFGVFGSGIVAEAGNETGDWKRNIVIQSVGHVWSFNGQIQSSSRCVAEGHPLHRFGRKNDPFFQGSGYGLRSRMIKTVDNIAVSINGAAFQFWSSGLKRKDGCRETDSSYLLAKAENFKAINGYDGMSGLYDQCPSKVVFRNFARNEVIASSLGMATTSEKNASNADIPTMIEEFKVWEVKDGIISFYQSNYHFKDNLYVGTKNYRGKKGHQGILLRDLSKTKLVTSHFENFEIGFVNASHQRDEQVSVFAGNTFAHNNLDYNLDRDGASRAKNFQFVYLGNDWEDAADWGRLEAKVLIEESDLDIEKIDSRGRGDFSIVIEKKDSFASVPTSGLAIRHTGPVKVNFESGNWRSALINPGYYEGPDGSYYVVIETALGDRGTGTVGVLPVAIKLSYANSPADFDRYAREDGMEPKLIGPLPEEFHDDQIGEFQIVDRRELGSSLNQLKPEDRTPASDGMGSDEKGHDHGSHSDSDNDSASGTDKGADSGSDSESGNKDSSKNEDKNSSEDSKSDEKKEDSDESQDSQSNEGNTNSNTSSNNGSSVTVSFNNFTDGQFVKSRKRFYFIGADATSSHGIARVEFRLDGEKICLDSKAPYSCGKSLYQKLGDHVLEAVATDKKGNVRSTKIKIFIGDKPPQEQNDEKEEVASTKKGSEESQTDRGTASNESDGSDILVQFETFNNNQLVKSRKRFYFIKAKASSVHGIAKVEIKLDGKRICVDAKAPYSCGYSLYQKLGDHVLEAIATDKRGIINSHVIDIKVVSELP